VRAAAAADATAIAAVGSRSFTAAYADSTRPEDLQAHIDGHFTPAAVRHAMRVAACLYLLAELGGQPAGMAQLRTGTPPGPVPADAAVEIRQLYVDPSSQRSGVGQALLDAARRRALRAGTEGLWLSVWEDAYWAVAFYEAAGFRAVGTAEFRVGSTLYRDLLMWMPVTGGRE
jgi:ribosomal protein S18 acetylase RimI-like enzyme